MYFWRLENGGELEGVEKEMEKRKKGGDLMAFYLKRRPQMCSGTGEALRTLTSPSVVAYLNSTSKTQRSREAYLRVVSPNLTPKAPPLSAIWVFVENTKPAFNPNRRRP